MFRCRNQNDSEPVSFSGSVGVYLVLRLFGGLLAGLLAVMLTPFPACADWIDWAKADNRVLIEGLDTDLEANVRAWLPLQKEPCDVAKWKIEKLAAQAPERIRQSLKALGYYHPQIHYHLQWLPACWRFHAIIERGPPVRIRSIELDISGAGKTEDFYSQLKQTLAIKVGDVLHHGKYEAIKNRLIRVSEDQGYFDYRFAKHELRVDIQQNQADIMVHFITGPRYYFGKIRLQPSVLEPAFIRKYLDIDEGQPYQRERISATHFALEGSGYFKNVRIEEQKGQALEQRLPLRIELQSLARHALDFGVGYDTDLGMRGHANYHNRYVTRSGHRFETRISISQKKSYFFMDYRIPLADPRRQKLDFVADFVHEDTDTVFSQTYRIGAHYSEHFKKAQVLMANLDFGAESFDNAGENKFKWLLVPSLSWSNVIAQGQGFARQGFKYSLKFQGASRYVLSDVNFAQLRFKAKYIRRLPWLARLLLRTDLGAMAVEDFAELPTSFRFYAGGDNSVRGYKYKAIGAFDQQGEVIGGQFLVVGSVEYEQLVYKQWSVAVFIDGGDAFIQDFRPKFGLGFGLRWYSVIGPIRVDLAFPKGDWQSPRLHFSFSTAL